MDNSTVNKLLLSLLRGSWDESVLRELPEAEWDSLVRQASRYSIAPLLYHRLKREPHIPASVLQILRTIYFETAWRNTKMYNELAKVLAALRQAEIPVIVLKGAYLAQEVYNNIALRPMSDVDILVKKDDLLRAENVLLELGYCSARRNDLESACAASQHLAPLTKKGSPAVEIHWTIVHPSCPFAIDVDGLWQRARPAVIENVDVLSLSLEDFLLHLCINTVYHRLYRNAIVFLDIREIISRRAAEIDWRQLWLRSCQWRAGNAVYLTLYLAANLFGADVPNQVLSEFKPESFRPELAAEAERIIFSYTDKENINPYIIKYANSKSFFAAAVLLLQRIFLSRDELSEKYRIHLNRWNFIFYHAVRLKDLLIWHGRTVLQLRKRDDASAQKLHLIDWLGR